MKISQMWKEKMISTLTAFYGKSSLNIQALEKELDRIISEKQDQFPELFMRNLYTGKNISVPLDDLLDIVKQEDLCILANNTLTYSYRKVKSPIPTILMESKKERNVHKNKAKEYDSQISKQKSEGTFVEGCELQLKYLLEEALQLKVKQFMNSIYGVQGQKGSMIYNPDTATGVTSQGRQLISEMLWAFERFLYGTLHFSSFGEYASFITNISENVHYDSPLLRYITYVPSRKECIDIMANQINRITAVDKVLDKVELSLYKFIDSMNSTERVYFYYKNNLFNLLTKNPRVFALIEQILSDPTEFMASGDDTPKIYLPIFDELYKILDEFVIMNITTPNRVFKYQNKRRRGIIISDTDSVIMNLNPIVQNIYKMHKMYNNLPITGRSAAFEDEKMDFKIINLVCNLCGHVTDVVGDLLIKNANCPEELRSWCNMKNEFLFKRVIMYKGVKKNYVCHVRLREGKFKDDISTTGIKMNSSTINPMIKDKMIDIIENDILKCEHVDPINVFRKHKDLERFIIQQVKNGDFTFGKKARFSGMKGYKTSVYQNNAGRSCLIWNLLNPLSKINTGDYCYIFNTILYNKASIEPLRNTYPEIYDKLISEVFENPKMPELAKYGLKSIAIPISASVNKIPDWIIPYIDYKTLTNTHLQPLISLLPSIEFKTSKFSGNKSTYSPLISF